MATYIIADTHGCLNTLRELLEETIVINRDDRVYFLGDYIDRGPSSAQLVEYIIDLKEEGYNLITIRGNHEQMILDSINSLSNYGLWMMNTGELTIKSYKKLLGNHFRYPKDIPEKHFNFYKNLPLYDVVDDKYILVHGGLNAKAEDPFADTNTILWSRSNQLPNDFMPHIKLIYGHTPTPLDTIKSIISNPEKRLIPLDAGCVYENVINGCGYLVALNTDDFTLRYVKNKDIDY